MDDQTVSNRQERAPLGRGGRPNIVAQFALPSFEAESPGENEARLCNNAVDESTALRVQKFCLDVR